MMTITLTLLAFIISCTQFIRVFLPSTPRRIRVFFSSHLWLVGTVLIASSQGFKQGVLFPIMAFVFIAVITYWMTGWPNIGGTMPSIGGFHKGRSKSVGQYTVHPNEHFPTMRDLQ